MACAVWLLVEYQVTRTMNAAAVNDVPALTVTMFDFTCVEDITVKQRMMSSCTGALLTSLFSESFYHLYLSTIFRSILCIKNKYFIDIHTRDAIYWFYCSTGYVDTVDVGTLLTHSKDSTHRNWIFIIQDKVEILPKCGWHLFLFVEDRYIWFLPDFIYLAHLLQCAIICEMLLLQWRHWMLWRFDCRLSRSQHFHTLSITMALWTTSACAAAVLRMVMAQCSSLQHCPGSGLGTDDRDTLMEHWYIKYNCSQTVLCFLMYIFYWVV